MHIAALWALAVAQPLFDLLGDNPEFFVAHRAARADILRLTLVLGFVLPSCLTLCVWLSGLIGTTARRLTLYVVLAGLTAVLAMQLTVRAGATTWLVAVPLAAAAGAAMAIAYDRLAVVRSFLTVLSISALVVPGVFLLKPGIRRLLAGPVTHAANLATPATSQHASIATPVVVVIFDELPLMSLLDAHRRIDPVLYPNLAALADDSLWFRNATTVNDFTRWAVPSIVSGKYPRHDALPSAIDHPDTLFTLLSSTHRLEVSEALTDLCPLSLCPRDAETSAGQRLAAIGRDLRVVFLRLILTDDLTDDLPDPTQTWARFGDDNRADADGQPRAANPNDVAAGIDDDDDRPAARAAARQRWREGISEPSRVTPVRRFIEQFSSDDPQPTFYFLHTLVSHHPYSMLPSGKQNATLVSVPGKWGGSWAKDQPWAVAQQYQRHLLQAQFVDRLAGQLVARLKAAGLYDRALVLITADHGIAHLGGVAQRNFSAASAAEIMRVPLIVKLPARLGMAPGISDVNAETIDILPTIADALDIDVTWPIDGTSLLDPARPERPSKAMFSGASGRRRDIAGRGPDMGPALQRKQDLFGDGLRNPQRAPRLGPLDPLLGRPVSALRVVPGGGAVEIAHAWEFDHVDPDATAAVFDVSGRFGSPKPDTFVAVAVNGTVEAVTRTWESNARGWLATPRLEVWKPGRNAIEVFVVEHDAAGLLLRRTSIAQVRPEGLNLVLTAASTDWGVRQWGFYPVEGRPGGRQFRWTRDRAELSNLFTHSPPRAVEIGAIDVPGGTPKALKVEANDCLLFEGVVRNGWSATLPLERCDIAREGLTLRFTTAAPRAGADRRRRGVALTSVVLK